MRMCVWWVGLSFSVCVCVSLSLPLLPLSPSLSLPVSGTCCSRLVCLCCCRQGCNGDCLAAERSRRRGATHSPLRASGWVGRGYMFCQPCPLLALALLKIAVLECWTTLHLQLPAAAACAPLSSSPPPPFFHVGAGPRFTPLLG